MWRVKVSGKDFFDYTIEFRSEQRFEPGDVVPVSGVHHGHTFAFDGEVIGVEEVVA